MSRHISPEAFYELPSGSRVHPCRLIHKDGTLMWKHALLFNNQVAHGEANPRFLPLTTKLCL